MVLSLVQRLKGLFMGLCLLRSDSQALQRLMHIVLRRHGAVVRCQGCSDAQLQLAEAGVPALVALERILRHTNEGYRLC